MAIDATFELVKEDIGVFLKEMLGRIGCFAKVPVNRMEPWGVVLYEKVGISLAFFDSFKEVGEFTSAVKSCLHICADDTKESE